MIVNDRVSKSQGEHNKNFLKFLSDQVLTLILLTGEYPAIPALQGGVQGYNIKETPCRKAPPFSAESFKFYLQNLMGMIILTGV